MLQTVATGANLDFHFTEFELGANRYLKSELTDPDLAEIAKFDAILLGAVGDPRVAPGVLERGLLLKQNLSLIIMSICDQ